MARWIYMPTNELEMRICFIRRGVYKILANLEKCLYESGFDKLYEKEYRQPLVVKCNFDSLKTLFYHFEQEIKEQCMSEDRLRDFVTRTSDLMMLIYIQVSLVADFLEVSNVNGVYPLRDQCDLLSAACEGLNNMIDNYLYTLDDDEASAPYIAEEEDDDEDSIYESMPTALALSNENLNAMQNKHDLAHGLLELTVVVVNSETARDLHALGYDNIVGWGVDLTAVLPRLFIDKYGCYSQDHMAYLSLMRHLGLQNPEFAYL